MANAGQSRLKNFLLWILGIAVIVLIVLGVRRLTREQVEVRVAQASYQTLSSSVSTNGIVEPVEEFQARAPFAGAIKEIYVKVGQQVGKGTLLLRMDDSDARGRLANTEAGLANDEIIQRDIQHGGTPEDLARNKSDIAAAQLDQQEAQKELAAKLRLQQQGAASASEVAAAQQRLDSANLTLQNAQKRTSSRYNSGDVQNAQARVADAAAAVASARNNLNNVDIHSPIDGTVYNVPFKKFDWVEFGKDVMDVADLHHMQIRAYFDEPEIGKLAVGQPVKITWDAKRDEVWHGHVTQAPTTVQTYGPRNIGVCLIAIDDPTPDLLPNTNVTATVTEMQRAHVLSIPREALHSDSDGSFVFRIRDGKLVRTPVTVGVSDLNSAEIVSGLQANESVVLNAKSSLAELTNGLSVKQVE